MLAMGAITFNEPEDMEIAKGLLETCVYMYRTTRTGLSPENWVVPKTEAYNPMTFNKTKDELSSLRDWWYEKDKINPLIQKKLDRLNEIEQEMPVKEQSEYFVEYKLPPVRERPESLFFGDKRYILRPETVESLFILYRITGDQKYQVCLLFECVGMVLVNCLYYRNMAGRYIKQLKNGVKHLVLTLPFVT
jgi:mannosyl-oligosaccharide alpha-1,2-mannosidase